MPRFRRASLAAIYTGIIHLNHEDARKPHAPQADLNLGIKTFLNGALVSNIIVDTTAATTDTIDYDVTDQNGLTSTSTRTVIVESPITPSN